MSRPRIVRAPEAWQDLIDIWAYISENSSPSIADRFIARIYKAIETAAASPYIGRERPEFTGTPRSLIVSPYIVFYQPLPNEGGICVWRIIHGARDLPNHVKPPA